MIKKIITILLFTIINTCLYSQPKESYSFNGRIVDSLGNGIEAVVVQGLSSEQQCLFATTSNSSGAFRLDGGESVKQIKFTHLQYNDIVYEIQHQGGDNIGEIVMREKKNMIDAVVVQTNYIKRKGADYTVKVYNNPLAENRNTLEFMNTLPGVNGLSINGKAISRVYINGRELKNLPPDQIAKYLAGLRAEEIENITIMPSGGAKYSADQRGGIIRIQMRRNEDRNFSGSVTLPISVNTENGAISTHIPINLNYRSSKFSSYTYIGGNYLEKEQIETLYSTQAGDEFSNNYRGYYGLTVDQSFMYDISDKHAIGCAINLFGKPNEASRSDLFDPTQSEIKSRIEDKIMWRQAQIALTYDWKLDSLGSNIHFSGDYMHNQNGQDMNYYTDMSSDGQWQRMEHTWEKTAKNLYSLELSSQINLADNKSTFNIGAQYIGMDARQRYNQPEFTTDGLFLYNEQLYSAYVEFSSSLAKGVLDVSAGLRYEGAYMKFRYDDQTTERKNNTQQLNDIFPSASITYNMPSGKDYLTLNYERFISRPRMSDFRPVVFRDSDNIYTVGATELKPEFENSISLTQTLNQKHTISLSYNWNTDLYSDIYEQVGDALIITSGNYGSVHRLKLYADTRFTLIERWLYTNLNASVTYEDYSHSQYGRTLSWRGQGSAMLELRMPEKWFASIGGSYYTPTVSPIDKTSALWGVSAAIFKQIGNRMTIGLYSYNLLCNNYITTESRQSNINYKYITRSYFKNITLSIVYNFGSLTSGGAKRSKVNREMQSRGSSN